MLQLSAQGALPAELTVVVGPIVTQAFWQFITSVSQLTRQAVELSPCRSGVGANGVG